MAEPPLATGVGEEGVDGGGVGGDATTAGGRRWQAAPASPAPASILSQRQRRRRAVDALAGWRRPRRRDGVQPGVSIVPPR